MAKKRKETTAKDQASKIFHPLPSVLPPFVDRHFWKLYLALCLILSLLFIEKALLPSHMLFGTDFVAGDLMTRKFLNDYPGAQWHPFVFGGVPLDDANPSDKYYPISLFIRFSRIIPYYSENAWLYLFHFVFSGILTYLLARELKLGKLPSALSGLAYMFTGQTVSLIYAGHLGKVIVSSLLPGMFLFIFRGIQLHRWREFVWAGGILGCALVSPQIPMTYYALFGVFFFWLILSIIPSIRAKRWQFMSKSFGGFALFLLIGFAISSIYLLSFIHYLPFSARGVGGGRGTEFAKSWSMPPEETINSIIPDFSGMSIASSPYDTYWGRNVFKLHSEYLGVLPLLMAVLGTILCWREKERKSFLFAFLVILALGLLFAWGGYTPFFTLFYYLLPYYKKLRAAGMAFFLVSFSTACLAGLGAEGILKSIREEGRGKGSNVANRGLTLGLGVAAVASLFLAMVVTGARDGLIQLLGNNFVSDSNKFQMLQANYDHFISGTFLFAVFLILQVILLILLIKRKLPITWWAGLAIGIMVVDLFRIDFRYRQIEPPPSQYFEADEVVNTLKDDNSLYRVLPLQYDKMGNYLMLFNLQNVLGEHGNQLQRYNEFVGTGKISMVDGHNLRDKPNVLNLLNAKYLIMANRPEDFVSKAGFIFPRLRLVKDGPYKVYENLDVLPRAFCVSKYEVLMESDKIIDRITQSEFDPRRVVVLEEAPALQPVALDSVRQETHIVKYSPNEIRLTCEVQQPSVLVLTDNYYPSWKAYVDGRPTKVLRADYTFRAISMPAGRHEVIFRFESKQFRLGLLISLLALLTLATVAVTSLVKGKSPA